VPPPLSLDEAQRITARLEEVVREQRVVLIGGVAGCGGSGSPQKCENLGLYTRSCEKEALHEEESKGRYYEQLEALKAAK
jgi:hypothetical protein